MVTMPQDAQKGCQQGRSERRGEEVHTALRVGRSPLEWILANGKSPPVLPTSEKPLLNVEPLNDARTKLADFFSILLHDNAAAGMNILPRQPPRLFTDDERHHVGNILGETNPLQRRHLDADLAELVCHHARLGKT
jgi:hypothetical protein